MNREFTSNTPHKWKEFQKILRCHHFTTAQSEALEEPVGGQTFNCDKADCPVMVVTAGDNYAIVSGISSGGCKR